MEDGMLGLLVIFTVTVATAQTGISRICTEISRTQHRKPINSFCYSWMPGLGITVLLVQLIDLYFSLTQLESLCAIGAAFFVATMVCDFLMRLLIYRKNPEAILWPRWQ